MLRSSSASPAGGAGAAGSGEGASSRGSGGAPGCPGTGSPCGGGGAAGGGPAGSGGASDRIGRSCSSYSTGGCEPDELCDSLNCFCPSSSLVCACSAIFLALSRKPIRPSSVVGHPRIGAQFLKHPREPPIWTE